MKSIYKIINAVLIITLTGSMLYSGIGYANPCIRVPLGNNDRMHEAGRHYERGPFSDYPPELEVKYPPELDIELIDTSEDAVESVLAELKSAARDIFSGKRADLGHVLIMARRINPDIEKSFSKGQLDKLRAADAGMFETFKQILNRDVFLPMRQVIDVEVIHDAGSETTAVHRARIVKWIRQPDYIGVPVWTGDIEFMTPSYKDTIECCNYAFLNCHMVSDAGPTFYNHVILGKAFFYGNNSSKLIGSDPGTFYKFFRYFSIELIRQRGIQSVKDRIFASASLGKSMPEVSTTEIAGLITKTRFEIFSGAIDVPVEEKELRLLIREYSLELGGFIGLMEKFIRDDLRLRMAYIAFLSFITDHYNVFCRYKNDKMENLPETFIAKMLLSNLNKIGALESLNDEPLVLQRKFLFWLKKESETTNQHLAVRSLNLLKKIYNNDFLDDAYREEVVRLKREEEDAIQALKQDGVDQTAESMAPLQIVRQEGLILQEKTRDAVDKIKLSLKKCLLPDAAAQDFNELSEAIGMFEKSFMGISVDLRKRISEEENPYLKVLLDAVDCTMSHRINNALVMLKGADFYIRFADPDTLTDKLRQYEEKIKETEKVIGGLAALQELRINYSPKTGYVLIRIPGLEDAASYPVVVVSLKDIMEIGGMAEFVRMYTAAKKTDADL